MLNTKAAGKRNGPWGSYAEARSWRAKALGEAEAGTLTKTNGTTLRAEAEAFLAGIANGSIRTRTGGVYKPATVRSYRVGWQRVDPELGAHKLTAIRRADVQALVDRLAADPELRDSTVRNAIDPLRAIYRRALRRGTVSVNPTTDLDVPQSDNKSERFASREEAAKLIAAIRAEDRALWTTAFYTGLRSGELRALRWSDIDLRAGLIHVRRGWDDYEGEQEPKSKAAKRRVPLIDTLVAELAAHQERSGRAGDDLVFGRTASLPFKRETMRRRALRDWGDARPSLRPITLHEARHTAASLMIAAGANAKALSVVMGHESITITFDRYGHLMPGGEGAVGRLLDAFVEGAVRP